MTKDKKKSGKEKKIEVEVLQTELQLMPSEWARQNLLDEMSYKYYDMKLGKVSEKEFINIKL